MLLKKKSIKNKYLTNRNVAMLGTVTFHAILFAIFTHVNLNVNKPDRIPELVINFIEQDNLEPDIKEEESVEDSPNTSNEFQDPITNQASSRSNEQSIEDLRSSMKSLEGLRDELDDDVDLFSDDAIKRDIPINREVTPKETTDGKGESDRKSENAFTGRSTINYYLENRYNDKLPNPIYTCITGGKIYVDIEVNQQGNIVDAKYNRRKSNTSDQCLIETALKYARRSKFNSNFSANEIQKGYITYSFHKG